MSENRIVSLTHLRLVRKWIGSLSYASVAPVFITSSISLVSGKPSHPWVMCCDFSNSVVCVGVVDVLVVDWSMIEVVEEIAAVGLV